MHNLNAETKDINLNCRNLKSINKIGGLAYHMIRGVLDYHIDHFSKSEETWSTILTFTYFKVRGDLVYHF